MSTLRYETQVLARGSSPPSHLTLAIVVEQQGTARWRGSPVFPDLVMLGRRDLEVDLLMAPTFGLWLLSVPESSVECGVGFDHLSLPRQDVDALLRFARAGLTAAQTHPERFGPATIRAFECEAIELVQTALHRGTPGLAQPDVLTANLEKELRSRLTEPVTLPEIAETLGASERTLRRACQASYGTSPMQLLKALRLNALRSELARADPKHQRVWEVAGELGFWHMGQLARDYRDLFGELPSETLARDRDRELRPSRPSRVV